MPDDCTIFKGERKKLLKNCQLSSFRIIFGYKTIFLSQNLFSAGSVYSYCNAAFKERVLFKGRLGRALKFTSLWSKNMLFFLKFRGKVCKIKVLYLLDN